MDRVSQAARSRIMSLVKSRNGKTTERRLRAHLAANGIAGWQMNGSELPGKPDFFFERRRVALFVDGCFWHGCECKRLSKTRRNFWRNKIEVNQSRDRRVVRELRMMGWKALRIR